MDDCHSSVAIGDETTAAIGISGLELSAHHVFGRPKFTVRMVRQAPILAGRVFNGTPMVLKCEGVNK